MSTSSTTREPRLPPGAPRGPAVVDTSQPPPIGCRPPASFGGGADRQSDDLAPPLPRTLQHLQPWQRSARYR